MFLLIHKSLNHNYFLIINKYKKKPGQNKLSYLYPCRNPNLDPKIEDNDNLDTNVVIDGREVDNGVVQVFYFFLHIPFYTAAKNVYRLSSKIICNRL